MDGSFCAKEKNTYPMNGWMDGWMTGWMDGRVGTEMGNEEEIMMKNIGGSLKRPLASLPPFLQLHGYSEKGTKQVEANLRTASITLLHKWPAGGVRCS